MNCAFFIVKVGLDTIRDSLQEFTAPAQEVLDTIHPWAAAGEGIMDMHGLWVQTSGGFYQMETHIGVDRGLTVVKGHRIAKAVEGCLLEEVTDLERVIVHVDQAGMHKRAWSDTWGPLQCVKKADGFPSAEQPTSLLVV